MTTPTQDRDITATLSAPREPTAEALEAAAALLLASAGRQRVDYVTGDWRVIDGNDGTYTAKWCWMSRHHECASDRMLSERLDYPTAQAAAVDLLRHHPELWPADPDETAPEPQPLTVAAREALRLLTDANHGDDGTLHHCCYACSEPWPCDVEQARRIVADALGAQQPEQSATPAPSTP